MFDSRRRGDDADVPSIKPKPCRLRRQFGRNVAALRSAAGLTQERLAEQVGLSARYVQAIEAGEYWPTLATLDRIRRALKAGWEQLLPG